VDKSTIAATVNASNYSIAVTSNATWTATVNSGAAWCTVSPASGDGDGTVMVTVEENQVATQRTATVIIAAGALNRTVTVTQAALPFYAASTQTWTFGSSTLTWSDVIQIPACNKDDFSGTTDAPKVDGRSYTHDGKTYYYYSWPYVNQNAAQLCPDPWRVPTKADFEALVAATTAAQLAADWGYGGYCSGSSVYNAGSVAYYRSSVEYSTFSAYGLYFDTSGYVNPLYYNYKSYGYQVRCVK
jgi:hypothetical protein